MATPSVKTKDLLWSSGNAINSDSFINNIFTIKLKVQFLKLAVNEPDNKPSTSDNQRTYEAEAITKRGWFCRKPAFKDNKYKRDF